MDRYASINPCRTVAESDDNYVAVNDTVGFNQSLTDRVTYDTPRVLVDKTNLIEVIKTFQPVP